MDLRKLVSNSLYGKKSLPKTTLPDATMTTRLTAELLESTAVVLRQTTMIRTLREELTKATVLIREQAATIEQLRDGRP